MTVYELVEKLGGEICRGRARILDGREYVIIGQLVGDDMEFTEAGRLLADQQVEPAKRAKVAKTITPEVVDLVVNSDELTAGIDVSAVPSDIDN